LFTTHTFNTLRVIALREIRVVALRVIALRGIRVVALRVIALRGIRVVAMHHSSVDKINNIYNQFFFKYMYYKLLNYYYIYIYNKNAGIT